ncbi:MAG: NADP-dependent oxidoreductase [Gammaproteobacteria bacterium]|nr:NADP-dependent oxidoreductase [Gammaproteobacteria bacterium]MCH2578403.1 NADP-dependent oxidoreductase [Pseudomonadales bacterium]MED5385226.1 NADP-dependent oxidoreductase [Pseudomonadota bacterium]MBI91196.1 NADP-dependent oxidoreductase [Gammaproteobacteria bacterium]MED5528819.1 NADP-dependent oxidoreductase [Pseudomonadota bacterium]|tara:strand:- start:13616 stop:14641 length:1026 start_codon:yes stop_codon:yes gene_type:complete
MSTNKRVLFAKRPLGEPDDDCFKIDEVEIPALGPNEILIKTCWLSLDPYMRGRMNDMKSYTEPMQIGDVMTGESTGIVEQSNSDKWQVGDRVAAHMGWQTYIVAKGDDARLMKVDLDNGSLSAHLGVVGMPGRTAYFGLTEVGKPKAGETLVVAAASGAVGSAVGQIAKILGLRAIGIAGGSEKCRYVKEELQFDDCLDYKSGNLDDKLSVACPDGIDLYFENVGGDVTKAVAPQLNQGARVPICGYISNYNDEDITKAETPFHILKQLEHVPEHRFFVVYEWQDRYDEATRQLGEWIKEGHLKYRESVGEGLENAPELFRGLLRGKNFGKQLVKIAEEEI